MAANTAALDLLGGDASRLGVRPVQLKWGRVNSRVLVAIGVHIIIIATFNIGVNVNSSSNWRAVVVLLAACASVGVDIRRYLPQGGHGVRVLVTLVMGGDGYFFNSVIINRFSVGVNILVCSSVRGRGPQAREKRGGSSRRSSDGLRRI